MVSRRHYVFKETCSFWFVAVMTMRKGNHVHPHALVAHASGTNRDRDVAYACELAGCQSDIVHLNHLRSGQRRLADYQILIIPGGFSYGDALGAGRLLALDLRAYFADQVREFVAAGKPVLGICNGFQALVKAGILPGEDVRATLTHNRSGRFECRWVNIAPAVESPCVWTHGLSETIQCPVAHGEGQFVPESDVALATLCARRLIALTYCAEDGTSAGRAYPANPNGSIADIAGVCNSDGNVLGLMPHPEDAVLVEQLPRWTRADHAGLGLPLFRNGIQYAAQL